MRKVVVFPAPVTGRYFRLKALTEVNGRPWTSIAELRLRAAESNLERLDEIRAAAANPDATALAGVSPQRMARISWGLAGAVAAFEHFALRLAGEYAIDPSPETLALVERVRGRQQ